MYSRDTSCEALAALTNCNHDVMAISSIRVTAVTTFLTNKTSSIWLCTSSFCLQPCLQSCSDMRVCCVRPRRPVLRMGLRCTVFPPIIIAFIGLPFERVCVMGVYDHLELLKPSCTITASVWLMTGTVWMVQLYNLGKLLLVVGSMFFLAKNIAR
ncbi:unnamed protein product [Periconia digitata]|uniref:Uncharacterized protein n=1 Tax=Periconia digitata TaxID=1303443 RepID=A0A9W4UNC8_9PLEO|nr:unnamed protein product [Periconia digitata]